MKESDENPLILTVSFYCLYAADFEVNIELVNANRVEGLQEAWNKAFECYCSNNIPKMRKQLKRKLGSIYNFDDLSDIVVRFLNANGKRDEIRVMTNYPMV
ncbi:hypothetical protein [Acinetobacter ursingii]|uniref:hypothetical protein n=1 Tax=Acinetobacter ursingii TaxID=108980 RepID=UPI00254A508B|nr:hypothetical protein [Acinetobacter ursingii]MEC6128161.1 hypothetical protein [Acinetobacter ursingii]